MEQKGAVRTTVYGTVQGIETGEVCVWYGIPYGKAPVGELRWRAPQRPEAWSDMLDAAVPAEQAMQLGSNGVYGTEDCLKLDIYSTQKAESDPVLVFLHGGNNQNGTTEELDGRELAVRDDIVVVSVGYRLGLLGFHSLPSVEDEQYHTGNFTLLDIAAALDWIRENIAAFGGDPQNVTISGFSAGGRDVMAMLISPLFAGKFEKAIAFSGGMTTADLYAARKKTAEYLAPLAVRDHKAQDLTEAVKWLQKKEAEVREYLYSLSAEELCGLIGGAAIRMNVFPHLFTDGAILPEEGFDARLYNQVPLMMVTGTTEFSSFVWGDPYFAGSDMKQLSEEEQTKAKWFAIRYGSEFYRYFNTDASAQKMSEYYRAPIYLCDINYGNTDSERPIERQGAFHGIFLPMIWSQAGCTADAPDGTFTHPAYLAMADLFHKYLKQFLYTGNPNGKGLPVWNGWDTNTRQSLKLDGAGNRVHAENKVYEDNFDTLINVMEKDNTITEDIKEKLIRNVLNGRWFSQTLDERYQN